MEQIKNFTEKEWFLYWFPVEVQRELVKEGFFKERGWRKRMERVNTWFGFKSIFEYNPDEMFDKPKGVKADVNTFSLN